VDEPWFGGDSTPTVVATCPPGKRVLGGGYALSAGETTESRPINNDTQWLVHAQGVFGGFKEVHAYAICAFVEE
jgi:hypothetical protein